jgi:hypothetical protein
MTGKNNDNSNRSNNYNYGMTNKRATATTRQRLKEAG